MKQRYSIQRESSIISTLYTTWNWSLSVVDTQTWLKKISGRLLNTRYPIKLLRYWFMYNFIREQQVKLGKPLRICEIGIDRGQMRRFVNTAEFYDIDCWVGVDCRTTPELQEAGYTKLVVANVGQSDFKLDEKYDVIIVLHILEHLLEPEKLMYQLSNSLTPNGIVIGGFPVTPKWLAHNWQKRIRLTASKFGHVSVFSPFRVKNMANDCRLNLNIMSGAFFLRKSGSFLESYSGWIRLNLVWGALFPSLGGEVYWRMVGGNTKSKNRPA